MRIVRPDGSACGPEETGELLVSGPNVMAGYWNRPEATRRVIDDEGWLHTGDAARFDSEGYVWIVDRVEDRYLSLGRVVYPGDVERVLAQHPAISEVGVVGVEGDRGQGGAAFVVLEATANVTEDELLEFGRQRLARQEVPKSVTFVSTLPRNSVGKLIRHELRRLARA